MFRAFAYQAWLLLAVSLLSAIAGTSRAHGVSHGNAHHAAPGLSHDSPHGTAHPASLHPATMVRGNPKAPALLSKPGMGVPITTCIARAAPGVDIASLAAGRVALDCRRDQQAFGPGDYWAVGRIPHHIGLDTIDVRVASVWQAGLTLNVRYADGHIERMATTSRTLSRHLQLGAIVEFRVPQRASPATMLIWEIRGSANARGILVGQSLLDHDWSDMSNLRMAALYAAFAGLAVALLVYHAAMWGALRHRFQLVYCLMVAMLLIYATSSSGALAWMIPGIDNNDRIRINYVTLGFAAAAALVFARTFFEERVFSGWLHRATVAAVALVALSGITFAALSYVDMKLGDTLYVWSFLGGILVVLPILWRAWVVRSDFLWLFALAWAAPILFAFARIISAMGYLPPSFWLDNSTVISMTAEALLSSLAIAYRVHTLTRERDAAVVRETIARRLADTDALTGLLNRRAFLTAAIGREGAQILHVIDIDHFKAVNDTLGHDGGDEVLRVFSRVLRAAVPTDCLVARIGGEEFAIVTAASAAIDTEELLARLRAARMPFDLSVTASIGSCTGPLVDELDWKTLYHDADRALFAAKSAGRDRARDAGMARAA